MEAASNVSCMYGELDKALKQMDQDTAEEFARRVATHIVKRAVHRILSGEPEPTGYEFYRQSKEIVESVKAEMGIEQHEVVNNLLKFLDKCMSETEIQEEEQDGTQLH